jgi:hypothetical protein
MNARSGWRLELAPWYRRLCSARLQELVPWTAGVVPLEKLILPTAVAGVDGVDRLPQHFFLI